MFRGALIIAGLAVILHIGVILISLERVKAKPPLAMPDTTGRVVSQEASSLLKHYGCGGCHYIPGIAGANDKVGPGLEQFANRAYIAGHLPNTPENLVHWLMNPQRLEPGTAMPTMNLTSTEAKLIAGFLYGYDNDAR